MLCSRSAQTLVSLKIRPTAIPLLSPLSSSATARGDPASQVVLRRRLSTQIDPSRLLDNTRSNLLPEKLLTAALPFVPTHGFSSATILAGAASEPELQSLAISSWTLSNLFPSTTTTSAMINPTGPCTEPIGPSKAMAERWIEEGNSHMKTTVKSENLVFKKHGLNGVQRAFEVRLAYNRTIPKKDLLKALALIVTPEDPFFGVRLPVELPHILPYGSHALNVAADALAGLQDYSKSREWMLRRIRLAGVYSAIELMSLGVDQPPVSISNEIQKLLDASESLATHTSNTVEFINYVNRSSRSIIQSFGLI
ncbi:hypothetical protein H4Q26_017988 [Puccinia striiformis f. sp. tritici PST-130]|nr:hypothetical protein H4Q26_017988 [Puccinia striiformis f. sp. tritici PST-130]